MNTSPPADVIAIDGPSGSGKSTVAGLVAARLGWRLLDSGALYRVVGLIATRRGIDLSDEGAVAVMAGGLDVTFDADAVIVDGDDETHAIRHPDIDAAASVVAGLASVRAALLARQRELRALPGLVADGRDMGTVVFPDAGLKVFLTASAAARAQRRYRQLGILNEDRPGVSLRALRRSIETRDERDRTRAVSPLVPAPDAVTIDTTAMSADDVAAAVLGLAEERGMRR